jgi:hypothetical protein
MCAKKTCLADKSSETCCVPLTGSEFLLAMMTILFFSVLFLSLKSLLRIAYHLVASCC